MFYKFLSIVVLGQLLATASFADPCYLLLTPTPQPQSLVFFKIPELKGSPALFRVVTDIAPNLERGDYRIDGSLRVFLSHAEIGTFIRMFPPKKRADYHFEKHEQEFRRAGFHRIRSERDYLQAAHSFGLETHPDQIMFRGIYDGHIYKIDLRNRRVLVLNGETHRIITFFIGDPRKHGFSTLGEYIFEKLYQHGRDYLQGQVAI